MNNKGEIQLCQFKDCNEIALPNSENKIILDWSVNVFCCSKHKRMCELLLNLLDDPELEI